MAFCDDGGVNILNAQICVGCGLGIDADGKPQVCVDSDTVYCETNPGWDPTDPASCPTTVVADQHQVMALSTAADPVVTTGPLDNIEIPLEVVDTDRTGGTRPAMTHTGTGIRVIRSGLFTVSYYAASTPIAFGGSPFTTVWQIRPRLNGGIGTIVPPAGNNVNDSPVVSGDSSAVSAGSWTTYLPAGTIVTVEVVAAGNNVAPISATTTLLAAAYHGSMPS